MALRTTGVNSAVFPADGTTNASMILIFAIVREWVNSVVGSNPYLDGNDVAIVYRSREEHESDQPS